MSLNMTSHSSPGLIGNVRLQTPPEGILIGMLCRIGNGLNCVFSPNVFGVSLVCLRRLTTSCTLTVAGGPGSKDRTTPGNAQCISWNIICFNVRNRWIDAAFRCSSVRPKLVEGVPIEILPSVYCSDWRTPVNIRREEIPSCSRDLCIPVFAVPA